jgi:hypothetical protein
VSRFRSTREGPRLAFPEVVDITVPGYYRITENRFPHYHNFILGQKQALAYTSAFVASCSGLASLLISGLRVSNSTFNGLRPSRNEYSCICARWHVEHEARDRTICAGAMGWLSLLCQTSRTTFVSGIFSFQRQRLPPVVIQALDRPKVECRYFIYDSWLAALPHYHILPSFLKIAYETIT